MTSSATIAASARLTVVITVALLLLELFAWEPRAVSQPPLRLAVITHPLVGEPRLDIDELRAVFMRRRLNWSSGKPIIVFNQSSGSPGRLLFDSAVMGFDATQAARYWIDARIRNGTQPPRTVSGDTMVVRLVTTLPDSIGYARAEDVTAGPRVVARIEAGRVLPP